MNNQDNLIGRMRALVELQERRYEESNRLFSSMEDVSHRLLRNAREFDDLRVVVGDLIDIVQKSKPTNWMTTSEAAHHYGVNEKTISRWEEAGIIKGYRAVVGGHPRYDQFELDRALKERRSIKFGTLSQEDLRVAS